MLSAKLLDILRRLTPGEFIRRNIPAPRPEPSGTDNIDAADRNVLPQPCPCCGGRLIVIEVFARASSPRHHSTNSPAVIKPDTS
jgi:hypothetical protein